MRVLRPGAAAALAAILLLSAAAHGAGSTGAGRIVFAAFTGDGDSQIATLSPAGVETALTRGPNDGQPSWSSDGRRIVFVRSTESGQNLYVIDANGGGETQLTDLPAGEFAQHPVWSPDGTRIAYSQHVVDALHDDDEIMVVPATGGRPIDVTNDVSADEEPTWSPDGKRIAFSSWVDGLRRPQLYAIDADGGNRVRLTENGADDFAPAWSPDGKRIAFTRFGPGQGGVWTKSVADGSERRVTEAVGYDQRVSWSPDGTRLVFGQAGGGTTHLFVVSASGGTLTQLSDRPGYAPDWRPVAVDLGVALSAPASGRVGAPIPFTVSVANGGSQGASGVTIRAPIPAQAKAAGRGCRGGSTLVCTVGKLASAATAAVRIVVRTSRRGPLTLTVSVAGTQADGEPENNRAQASVAVR